MRLLPTHNSCSGRAIDDVGFVPKAHNTGSTIVGVFFFSKRIPDHVG